MLDKWLNIFKKTYLFNDISDIELTKMFKCLNPSFNSYKKNNIIATMGETFTGIGILLSGSALIVKDNAAGERVIMDILKPGDMFGEMAAFSRIGKWPATITTQDDCNVVTIPANSLISNCGLLCEGHRIMIQNLLKIISEKALMLNRKVEYLSIKSLRGRIGAYLIEQYNMTGKKSFLLSMKRNELAEFMNIPRPSLSREMCKMRDEGLIEFHRSSIKIFDVDALKISLL
jgi:CRP-like cAMP-binding protein